MKSTNNPENEKKEFLFERYTGKVTKALGSSTTIVFALAIIIGWAATGPIFKFSDTWQLVMNTFTNVVTFLMVFIIQQTQNKDTLAIQLKLNELIAASRNASNRMISIEDLSDDELKSLKDFYLSMSHIAQKDKEIKEKNDENPGTGKVTE